ncbi:serine/threonine-protein kinase [Agromyces bracchium]|uniref:non-specific serine/threonine protein kinase n=1 Tax=Agromyces bracchium TaxID=88376 RepID=A0A6I3MB84_9MICO|nr:serine/threonine-protein kinase [Agromyces bracchium]MTH70455.1 protein kinase [Agromyces bracchium]
MDSPTEQVANPATDPVLGSILADRYRVDGLIGRGGMAAVYRADDLALGRRVAVKVFTASAEGIDDADRRRSETALLASLTHPALVTLYDAAKDPASRREFLVMELVDGEDLRRVLDRGPIPLRDAARVLADLAEGLHVIHSRGIVHRDVKPANVLLAPAHLPTRRWNAKLADFGIARLLDESRLTATGRIIGTPGYLSPEQVRGEAVGSSADVYSLGLLLLEAVTGAQPYPGPALESASARLVRDPHIPTELPAGWRDLLAAMTARDPADRPTALDVALATESLVTDGADPGETGAATAIFTPAVADDGDTRVLPATRVDGSATPSAAASDDDATADTRVLTGFAAAPAVPGPARAADGVSAPRRLPRRLVIAIAAALVVIGAAVIVPVAVGALAGGGAATEPTPSEAPMPSVEGDLGTHLDQLEEAVSP